VPTATTVVAYLGNGDGTFTQKSTTSIPTGGYVVLADFNHDGKLGFATSGNLLAVGNGDGTFQTPAPFITSPPIGGFYDIVAGDLNADGWPDLLLTNPFNQYIYVLMNNKRGGFKEIVIEPQLFTAPAQTVLADLNGDGNLDAVIGVLAGGAEIWLGNGRGGLTYTGALTSSVSGPNPVAIGDVNGDGIPDVCLLEGGTVAAFLGNGDGTFQPQIGIGAGPAPGGILVENLHGQSPSAGLPDIVAPDSPAASWCSSTKPRKHALPRQRPARARRAHPPGVRATSGKVGVTVTILGTNLTGATSVTFNGTPATPFTVNSSGK
jgi:hypothetical protein